MFIGGRNGLYDGSLDNVAIWSRLLTQDEIDGLYDSGAGDFYSAYWDVYLQDDPIRFAWSVLKAEIRRIS